VFQLHGIEVIFEASAVDAIVELGFDNGLGVRGLSQAIWERCHGLVSELPQLIESGIARIVLDRCAIEQGKAWKIPGEVARERTIVSLKDVPPTSRQIEWHPNLPKVTDTSHWTKAQLSERVSELRPILKFAKASSEAKSFWEAFESKHEAELRPVVRLGECLSNLHPTGSVQEFYEAWEREEHADERFVIFAMLSERYRGKKDRKPKAPKKPKADDTEELF
jgi:hypothetical protein